jgi:hypothetical protein
MHLGWEMLLSGLLIGKNQNLGGEIHPDFLYILPIDKSAARPRM